TVIDSPAMEEEYEELDSVYGDMYSNADKIVQYGDGMDDYFRVATADSQAGEGLGAFIRGLWNGVVKVVKPLVKPAMKSLGKHAFNTTKRVITDVAQGEDWKSSAKRRMGEAGDEIVGQLGDK